MELLVVNFGTYVNVEGLEFVLSMLWERGIVDMHGMSLCLYLFVQTELLLCQFAIPLLVQASYTACFP